MKSFFHSFMLLPNETTAVTQPLLSLSLYISLHLQNHPPEVSCNFTKFTRKHLCQCLLFKKVGGLRPATLLKKRLWHRSLPVKFAKFLEHLFYRTTSRRLLLHLLFLTDDSKKLSSHSFIVIRLFKMLRIVTKNTTHHAPLSLINVIKWC